MSIFPAFIVLILFTLAVLVLVFEIAMFLDVLKNRKLSDNEKILWVLGMFLIHPIIAIVYYFMAHSRLPKR